MSWSLVSGTLPTGLTLNVSTGAISGTPAAAGTSTVTLKVQDSGSPQQSAQRQFTLAIIVSGTGGGGGQLTVSGAPANFNIQEAFTANPQSTKVILNQNLGLFDIEWVEGNTGPNHLEQLAITGSLTDDSQGVTFLVGDRGASGIMVCNSLANTPTPRPLPWPDGGNRSAGTATFVKTVLMRSDGVLFQPSPWIGTLTFTPF